MIIRSVDFVKGIKGTDDILYDGKPQICFVGRSNVGKSSAINALVGRKDLVKVGKKPGKTTEINFFLVNRKFYFVDLPGYGYAKLPAAEREQIRKMMLWFLTSSEVKPALVVLVVDAKVGMTEFDRQMAEMLRNERHEYVIVANKIDKLNQAEKADSVEKIEQVSRATAVIPFSAKDKTGIDVFWKVTGLDD